MTIEATQAAEISKMRARRYDLIAERESISDNTSLEGRVWAIETELDSIDDRLRQLGLTLDTVA